MGLKIMNNYTENITDYRQVADTKDFATFKQAAESVCSTREEWKALKGALDEKITEINISLTAREMDGHDTRNSPAHVAKGHIVRKMTWVDTKLSSMTKCGHWLMWVNDHGNQVFGWVATTVHPMDWIGNELAQRAAEGGDVNDLELVSFWSMTSEQFNRLPEGIEGVKP